MSQDKKRKLADACIKDFYVFLRNFWYTVNSDEFVDNWHIHELCWALQNYGYQVARKDKAMPDLIINVSPGSSKSTIVSQMFNVWLWLIAPWAVVISSSYSQTLSTEHSTKTKEIFKSAKFNKLFQSYFKARFKKPMKLTKDTERDWINNHGGRRFATATNGSVMGVHAHIILIDDPMNMAQSLSKNFRDKANKFNTAGLATRKKDKTKTPTVLVMQRLHEEDTTGYMMEKAKEKNKEIYHYVMPAKLNDYVKPERLKEKYKQGYFDPNRLPEGVLQDQKVDLGSYQYSGQYGQRPFPDEGGKVKKEWFTFTDEVPKMITWDIWIDGAYTDKTENDPTGKMICGHDPLSNKLYIAKFEAKRLEMPAFIADMKDTYDNSPFVSRKTSTYAEPKATGHSVKQLLSSETDQIVKLIKSPLVSQGKEARLQTASPRIEAGQVILLRGGWNDKFMDQICFFPNASEDEAVDLIGYACDKYFKKKKKGGVKRRR